MLSLTNLKQEKLLILIDFDDCIFNYKFRQEYEKLVEQKIRINLVDLIKKHNLKFFEKIKEIIEKNNIKQIELVSSSTRVSMEHDARLMGRYKTPSSFVSLLAIGETIKEFGVRVNINTYVKGDGELKQKTNEDEPEPFAENKKFTSNPLKSGKLDNIQTTSSSIKQKKNQPKKKSSLSSLKVNSINRYKPKPEIVEPGKNFRVAFNLFERNPIRIHFKQIKIDSDLENDKKISLDSDYTNIDTNDSLFHKKTKYNLYENIFYSSIIENSILLVVDDHIDFLKNAEDVFKNEKNIKCYFFNYYGQEKIDSKEFWEQGGGDFKMNELPLLEMQKSFDQNDARPYIIPLNELREKYPNLFEAINLKTKKQSIIGPFFHRENNLRISTPLSPIVQEKIPGFPFGYHM